MGKPENVVDCWILNESEFEDVLKANKSFNPVYIPYAYFLKVKKMNENTMEGYLGRNDSSDNFHREIISTYTYFQEYNQKKQVYLTFNKSTFYQVDEIYPSKPLLITIKRVNCSQNLENDSSTKTSVIKIEKAVQAVHFEDRSGSEFERLVFSYVYRTKNWKKIEWLGQTGCDNGRDIWGVSDGSTFCYQCANYRQLVSKKVTDDIDKLIKNHSIPDFLIVICGGRVGINSRKLIKSYAARYGIRETEIWSGVEFEEKLRNESPELLKRFVDGEAFPELKNVKSEN